MSALVMSGPSLPLRVWLLITQKQKWRSASKAHRDFWIQWDLSQRLDDTARETCNRPLSKSAPTVTRAVHNPIRGVGLPGLRGYAACSIRGEATMAATTKLTSGQKAAQTRKRRAAGRKAAATRKRNATAAKAAATRKRNKKTQAK